ncbi:MAG: DUF805 domain-containing protein [Dysgonamonadaceae bacterium]|jgi:uncharacterized membrane protein YhaH (DUF805 family)|nr:DUF805 domain-containing protein [Dysgonamonadaceae bacterium]
MKWYLRVLNHYADFSGRARRREYWYFVLFNLIFLLAAVFIDAAFGWDFERSGKIVFGPCYMTYAALAALPGLAAAVRRLHDIGKSGWWILIALIPLVGLIWLIALLCIDSNPNKNAYGGNPKDGLPVFSEPQRLKSIAVTFIAGAAALLIANIGNYVQNHEFFHLQVIVNEIIFLALILSIGILLYPTASRPKGKMQPALVCMLIYGAFSLILQLPQLRFNAYNAIFSLLYVAAMIGFAFYALNKSKQKEIAIFAIALITFCVINIIISITLKFKFNFDSFVIYYYTNITSIAFILLAIHFLPRREEEGLVNSTNNLEGVIEKAKAATPKEEKPEVGEETQYEPAKFSISTFRPCVNVPNFSKEEAYKILEKYLETDKPQKMNEEETELLKPLFLNLMMYFRNEAYKYAQSGRSFGGMCDSCCGSIARDAFYLMGSYGKCEKCTMGSIVSTLDWNYYLSNIISAIGQVPPEIVSQAYNIKNKISKLRAGK